MNDPQYVDVNTYTRAETVARLSYGTRWDREETVTASLPYKTT